VSPRSFWPPLQAAQVDYETLRAYACEHARLPETLAAARFARRGLAGLIAWPSAERSDHAPVVSPSGDPIQVPPAAR
jgi:hypothetical protein